MGVTGPAQGQPEGQRQEPFVGSLTQSTSVFIRRSILVLLNFVLPLFCISLVSGPRKAWEGLGKPNIHIYQLPAFEPLLGILPSLPLLQMNSLT